MPALFAAALLAVRQSDGFWDDEDPDTSFWDNHDGRIARWAVFLSLLVAFIMFLLIGRWHANKRMARGEPPLAYHRWLVNRAQLANFDPRYAHPQPSAYARYRPPQQQQPGDAYGMYDMPPPPVYDPTAPRPPGYDQAPRQDGGSKIDPDQRRDGPSTTVVEESYAPPPGPPPPPFTSTAGESYAPPPGPPPSAVQPQGTGASNNPYRN